MNIINIPTEENEIWKKIDNHPDYYISNFGRVYSFKRDGKMLSPCIDKFGYCMLHLWENNVQHMVKVHRLVAEAFIPNPQNLLDVNHKDEDKTNNHVDNLEWCSRKYNLNFGTRNERASNSKKRAIIMVDTKTLEVIRRFDSVKDAASVTGINASNIAQVCIGNRKTAGGYIWRHEEEDKKECM